MTKNVLAVCQSCAEHNGGEFKNLRNTPPLFLGQCGCCKKIKACTHINYWKNIGSDTDMVSCEEQHPASIELDTVGVDIVPASIELDTVGVDIVPAPAAPAPRKAAAKKSSVLGE